MRKNVSYVEGIPRSVTDIERVYQMIIPSVMSSSTLVTGNVATSTSLDPTARINSWGSTWGASFRQYCVTKIVIAASFKYSTNGSGMIWLQVTEDSANPTGLITAEEKAVLMINAPSDPLKNSATITWTPRSSEDLAFTSVGTSFVPAYYKVYGNTTNTGTSAGDSTTSVNAIFYYHIAFRYFQ